MDRTRLEAALADAFDGSPGERRAVARRAGDLADSGRLAADRGTPLTVDAVVADLADAPAETSLAARWNWWIGSLEVAYGGYAEFAIDRYVDDADG